MWNPASKPARITGSEIHLEIPRVHWEDKGKWDNEKNEISWKRWGKWKLLTFVETTNSGQGHAKVVEHLRAVGSNCMEALEKLIQRGMLLPQLLKEMEGHGCKLK
jgi:hypothetical protein